MATKKTSEPKERKYQKLDFSLDQLAGCCGVAVARSFREGAGYYGWGKPPPQKRYTKEQQINACYKDIVSQVKNAGYTTCLITLVSNYSNADADHHAQEPELEQKLIDEGWTIHNVFINPNHGNEVTLYGKHWPEWVDGMMEDSDDDDNY